MSKFLLYVSSYILLLTSGIIILRFWVPRDYLNHGRLSPITIFFQALLFFTYGGFPYLYLEKDWPAVSIPLFIQVAGGLLVFIGLIFLLYGMFRLGIARSLGSGKTHLEQSGIYSSSRNPQALACGFYVLGFFLLWPSWHAVGWAFLYFPLIHMMVITEENHLRQKYGQKYQEYCEKTPRYFGRNTNQKRVSA